MSRLGNIYINCEAATKVCRKNKKMLLKKNKKTPSFHPIYSLSSQQREYHIGTSLLLSSVLARGIWTEMPGRLPGGWNANTLPALAIYMATKGIWGGWWLNGWLGGRKGKGSLDPRSHEDGRMRSAGQGASRTDSVCTILQRRRLDPYLLNGELWSSRTRAYLPPWLLTEDHFLVGLTTWGSASGFGKVDGGWGVWGGQGQGQREVGGKGKGLGTNSQQ